MKFKTLDDFQWKGKCVLLRSDLNSELIKGKPQMSDRIVESAKTIRELIKKGAKVVVLAHQGTPGKSDCISLKRHAKLLNEFVKIKFVEDTIGERALKEIKKLENGEAILLENVRFVPAEMKPSLENDLVKKLAPLFDVYVNDAFSVCHREQTSIVSFPKVLKSCVGRTMEHELKVLEKLDLKEALFILGGAKVGGNVKLSKIAKKVLATGVFGAMVVYANGTKLGAEEKVFADEAGLVEEMKSLGEKVIAPVDFAIDVGKRKEILLDELPSDKKIQDIGSESLKLFAKEIMAAKTIFMRGTAGVCEDEKFQFGTRELFKAILKSKAFSVIGGGHTITALKEMGFDKKKFGYVSLSGGALESFVAGDNLPGLEALEKQASRIHPKKDFSEAMRIE